MSYLAELFVMAMTAIFIQNFVLSRFLGLCPYLGVSKKLDSAIGMGMAVIFVMTMASAFTFLINKYLLLRFDIVYLQTICLHSHHYLAGSVCRDGDQKLPLRYANLWVSICP